MPVRLEDDVIVLEGHCEVEDAELLFGMLQASPGRVVDLSLCRVPHSAVWQVLLAFTPAMRGEGDDPFTQHWLVPALIRRGEKALK